VVELDTSPGIAVAGGIRSSSLANIAGGEKAGSCMQGAKMMKREHEPSNGASEVIDLC
jgi:hypothetical protein